MLADLRINEVDEMRLEAFMRAFLILPHQARIPHHIGGEDRGEAAGGGGRGHGSSSPPFSVCRGELFIYHKTQRWARIEDQTRMIYILVV